MQSWILTNMNYSLAKELKDAGYQLKTCPEPGICCTDFMFPLLDNKYYHLPSLEELIEACFDNGSTFCSLKFEENKWIAYGYNHKKDIYAYCSGITPSEAVARLWLELNK